MLIRGDRLTPRQRELVLAAFIYRWTKDNPHRGTAYGVCPVCNVKGGLPESTRVGCRQHHPVVALQTDEEWLRGHAFHFVKDGKRLMENHKFAEPAFMAEEDR